METFGVVPEISWSSFELEDREAMEQLLGPYIDSSYNDLGAYCCFLPSCAHQSQNRVPMVFPCGGDLGSDPSYLHEEPLGEARNTEFCEPSLSPGGASKAREKKKKKASMVACKGNSNTKRARKIDEVIDNNSKSNAGLEQQCTSSCSLENDLCASKELEGGNAPSGATVPTAMKGKASAGRGAATDPQSIYARRRRERINERLRILQNLVPNGSKVDISTMLEEAVQYVKFLQLQIRLLSSDELWMYAPLANHGMNIGLLDLLNPSSKQ